MDAIARLRLEDGDVVLFDARAFDINSIYSLCGSGEGPSVTFVAVKLMVGQRIQDVAYVIPKANITVQEP